MMKWTTYKEGKGSIRFVRSDGKKFNYSVKKLVKLILENDGKIMRKIEG